MNSKTSGDWKENIYIVLAIILAACYVVGFASAFSFLGKSASVVGVILLLVLLGRITKRSREQRQETEKLERAARSLELVVKAQKEKEADLLAGRVPNAYYTASRLYSLWKVDGIESAGDDFQKMRGSDELRRAYFEQVKGEAIDPRSCNYKQEYLDFRAILRQDFGEENPVE